MSAFSPIDHFVEHLAHKVHDFSSDQLVVALCNAANAPTVGDEKLSDLVTIDHSNLSSRNITTSASAQTGGVYKLTLADLTLTASDTVPAFRYVVVFNDDAANDELLGWYDYGEDVALGAGEQFVVDFDDANGMFDLQVVAP